VLPIIHIGPLALPAPQIIMLVGFWLAYDLSERHSSYFKVNPSRISTLILVALLAGFAGARLAYAAQSFSAFRESPLSLLALRPEMLNPVGGWLAAILAAAWYARSRAMPLWPVLDTLTTLFAVLAVTLGLSHLAAGSAFGAPTRLPWAIQLWGENRHPSQVYETLAAVFAVALTWPGGRISDRSRQAGSQGLRFWVFLAVSALARIFLESFRGDSILLMDMIRQAQVIAWGVLALSLWQIGRRIGSRLSDPAENTEGGADVIGG
jgi:prolipoprotein diacylglyceryltransferase